MILPIGNLTEDELKKPTIVFVDDQPFVIDNVAQELLFELGEISKDILVITIHEISQALDFIGKNISNIILLVSDGDMSGMHGKDFISKLKETHIEDGQMPFEIAMFTGDAKFLRTDPENISLGKDKATSDVTIYEKGGDEIFSLIEMCKQKVEEKCK